MNFIQEIVIRPLLMGDKMKINAFTVFIAIFIGGYDLGCFRLDPFYSDSGQNKNIT